MLSGSRLIGVTVDVEPSMQPALRAVHAVVRLSLNRLLVSVSSTSGSLPDCLTMSARPADKAYVHMSNMLP